MSESVLGKRNLENADDVPLPKHKKQKLSEEEVLPLDNTNLNISKDGDGVVVLNVGGIKFQTTVQTLTGYQSMLKARFSTKYAIKPSKDGSYFVDGDGTLFPYILKYLRTGILLLPTEWKKSKIWEFYIETKYYMVESIFDKILLKLFDSSIMKNEILKLKVVNKVAETLEWNKKQAMESLIDWKFIGSFPDKTAWGIGHTLILVKAENKIYGIFIRRYETANSGDWYLDFSKSFAFNCGANSCHLLSSYKEDDIKIDFKGVRKLTDDEKNMKDEKEDDESLKLFKYGNMDFHPLSFRGITKQYKKDTHMLTSLYGNEYTEWKVKFWEKDTDKYRSFKANEIWSIPA